MHKRKRKDILSKENSRADVKGKSWALVRKTWPWLHDIWEGKYRGRVY